MKGIASIVLIFSFGLQVLGQSPGAETKQVAAAAPVAGLEWEASSRSTYKMAAENWKRIIDANASNEEAWLNYYKAMRAAALLEDGAKPGKKNQSDLNSIIGRMSNAVPSNYAFNYCNYVNGNKSDESFPYLHNAIQMRPEDTDLWDDMLCDAVLSDNASELKRWVKKINDARLFSWAELEYNRNTLNSVEQNGLLITNGNVDTTPLYMLQSEGFRKDVVIVCLDWLGSSRYLHLLEAQLKVKPGVIRLNDAGATFAAVMNLGKSRAIYSALTVPRTLMGGYAEKLYCTGLAMKYSEQPIDNIVSLAYNWESLFQKQYWTGQDAITRNYLLPAQLLLSYYQSIGAKEKANEISQLIAQKRTMTPEPYIER